MKSLQTIAHSEKYKINTVYHTQPLPSFINDNAEITLVNIDERMMKSISLLNTPSTILTLVETLSSHSSGWNRAIYLDAVQDPGNVGTIIRIADWFGIDTVIRSPDSADYYSPKVIQSTMGAFANVQLLEMENDGLLKSNSYFIAADMGGVDIKDANVQESFTLIVGSEGQGLSPIFNNKKIQKVSIQGHSARLSESLNVSVATGIICAVLTG
ncbi:MAG: TrmH family RNA methyltransferase [Saprospiraceae bacterium]